jgi:two-component system CheB/CheR fusion protein
VILSGTGPHGTLGLKAVKASGGMAMVQDPLTAEYPRMPQSAISTGLADYVLPPEQMPAALVKYVRHSYVNGPAAEAVETPDHMNRLLALLRARAKLDFRYYRRKMLARRVERRMGLNHIDELGDDLAHLREYPEEVDRLTRDLLLSVTSFFRDPEAFHALESEVIARLVAGKESDGTLRVWVPGCATGEEPYSIAMLFLERLAAAQKMCRLQMFATDVDEEALEVARQGIYPESISADVSPERLARFFTRADDSAYQIGKPVREVVVFAAQNLISDAPFSKMDLISCRNVLIYLESDVQNKILDLLHFGLNPGGYLFLGPSESIGRQTDLFEPVSKKWRIYRRIGATRPERVEIPIATGPEVPAHVVRPIPGAPVVQPVGFAELAQRLLLEELSPTAVLINRKYEILYSWDRSIATSSCPRARRRWI